MSRLVLLLGEDFCQCQPLFSDMASTFTRDQVDVAPSSTAMKTPDVLT